MPSFRPLRMAERDHRPCGGILAAAFRRERAIRLLPSTCEVTKLKSSGTHLAHDHRAEQMP